MIVAFLLLTAAVQATAPARAHPAPPVLSVVSCNVAVVTFAPRSDVLDEKAAQALDRIPAEARSSLEIDGVKLMVLPHPVLASATDPAARSGIADARGQKIRDYLTAHGYPADRIGIRPADVKMDEPKNWSEGALLMVEAAPEVWDKTRLSAIC